MASVAMAVATATLRLRDMTKLLLFVKRELADSGGRAAWAARSRRRRSASRQGAADEEPAARHEPRPRTGKFERRGDRAAHGSAQRRERALADVAAGEQRQQEHEGRGEEQEPGVEAAHVQADEPERGEHDHAAGGAHRVMRAPAHRTVAFTVVVYSSKSDTRSVTETFQSPPGLSVTASAT